MAAGVLVNWLFKTTKPNSTNNRPWFVVLANFHGVNTLSMAQLVLLMCPHRRQSWKETHTVGSFMGASASRLPLLSQRASTWPFTLLLTGRETLGMQLTSLLSSVVEQDENITPRRVVWRSKWLLLFTTCKQWTYRIWLLYTIIFSKILYQNITYTIIAI